MQEKFLIFHSEKNSFWVLTRNFRPLWTKFFIARRDRLLSLLKHQKILWHKGSFESASRCMFWNIMGFFNTHKGYALSMFPRILHRCRRLKLSLAFRGLFRPVWDLVDAFGIPFPRHCTFAKLNEWFKSRSSLDQLLTSWKDGRETRSSFNLESSTGFASAAI